jgi:hypothetical protein
MGAATGKVEAAAASRLVRPVLLRLAGLRSNTGTILKRFFNGSAPVGLTPHARTLSCANLYLQWGALRLTPRHPSQRPLDAVVKPEDSEKLDNCQHEYNERHFFFLSAVNGPSDDLRDNQRHLLYLLSRRQAAN